MGSGRRVILVTGAGGLLGACVARSLVDGGADVRALWRDELDISDEGAVRDAVGASRPSVVVNCAALTNVDLCEKEPDHAWAVNADGPAYLASAAAAIGAAIVHVSTDYVFDGTKGGYVETDATGPIQVYGRTKLDGEERVRRANPRHFVVRSAWIFGAGGRNFISQLPRLVREGKPFRAICDQRSSPTYAPDLAGAIASLIGTDAYGTYHVTNEGSSTHAEFCRAALDVLGSSLELTEIPGSAVDRPAPRPRDTSLAGEAYAKAGFTPLRPWRQAAETFLVSAASA